MNEDPLFIEIKEDLLVKILKPVTESMAELYPQMRWISLPNKVGYVMHFGRVYGRDMSGTKWDTLIGKECIEMSENPIEELMALKEVQFLAGIK